MISIIFKAKKRRSNVTDENHITGYKAIFNSDGTLKKGITADYDYNNELCRINIKDKGEYIRKGVRVGCDIRKFYEAYPEHCDNMVVLWDGVYNPHHCDQVRIECICDSRGKISEIIISKMLLK